MRPDKSAPAPTARRRRHAERDVGASADGSALAVLVAELVRAVREEARAAVREELAGAATREPSAEGREWLTTSEVARGLGRSEKTVRHWIQARGLAAQKHLGVWRVRAADLDAFITAPSSGRERSVAASILAELHRP